jgi:excisionase family DNA binding protein
MTTVVEQATDEPLMSAAEVAKWFGLSKAGVYALVREARLPAIKFGRSVRFAPADMRAYLKSQTTVVR